MSLVQTYPVINLPMGGLLDPIGQWQRQMERELRSSADELAVKALSDNSSPLNPRAMCMHLCMHC
jgi:hypothetical protein